MGCVNDDWGAREGVFDVGETNGSCGDEISRSRVENERLDSCLWSEEDIRVG